MRNHFLEKLMKINDKFLTWSFLFVRSVLVLAVSSHTASFAPTVLSAEPRHNRGLSAPKLTGAAGQVQPRGQQIQHLQRSAPSLPPRGLGF